MAYEIKIDNFEGPLDLLLHLIKQHEMDIYDIPMVEITRQYLATLDALKSLNLDIAGEFLVMAATLIHIKSRLLLPQSAEEEAEEEELDPRAELVRRLLEYQKYKQAAVELDQTAQLERDVFLRQGGGTELADEGEGEWEAVGLYQLVEALRTLLKEHPQETFHEVDAERLSVTERINGVLLLLEGRESLGFAELFEGRPARGNVVVTLLALLELVKLRLLRILQPSRGGAIWLFPAITALEGSGSLPANEETLGYL